MPDLRIPARFLPFAHQATVGPSDLCTTFGYGEAGSLIFARNLSEAGFS